MKKKILYITSLFLALNVILVSNSIQDNSILKGLCQINTADAESGDCNNKRDVLTGQKFVCVSVDAGASFSIGAIVSQLSAELRGQGSWELTDCYKIDCYDGAGSDCCTTMDWTVCESTGCPEASI